MSQWGSVDNQANSVIWAGETFTESVLGTANVANHQTMFGNTTAGQFKSGLAVGVFGVSAAEMQAYRASSNAGRPAASGWVNRKEGTGGRAGRVQTEVLVAMKGISGDAADDTIFMDYQVTITTQPSDSEEQTGNAISFTVVAASTPSGATLAYQWQESPNVANSQLWTSLSNGGVYANVAEATLNISDNTNLDGNAYRVLVTTAGGANVTSDYATLTEV